LACDFGTGFLARTSLGTRFAEVFTDQQIIVDPFRTFQRAAN
jgi:hypothetical protein